MSREHLNRSRRFATGVDSRATQLLRAFHGSTDNTDLDAETTLLEETPPTRVSNPCPLFSEDLLNSPSALHAGAAQPAVRTPETTPAAFERDVSVPPAGTDLATPATAEPPQLSRFPAALHPF
jgi:hypothetical protein